MDDVKVYLSHGNGVNSWALYLWLMEQGEVPGEDFEAIFVNHGTDWPETYEYMDMMIAKGYPVTVVVPEHEHINSVYDYCLRYSLLPSRRPGYRWCTANFKIKALLEYYQRPCVEYIGFAADEPDRPKSLHERDGVTSDYPLIAEGIDRQGCIDIIKRHGLPIPPKSGCYICPFQRRSQWIELREKHPDLFCRAQKLECLCNERRAKAGKTPVYYKDRPLEQIIQTKDNRGRLAARGQLDMFDDHDRPPCRCGL